VTDLFFAKETLFGVLSLSHPSKQLYSSPFKFITSTTSEHTNKTGSPANSSDERTRWQMAKSLFQNSQENNLGIFP